ncbi:MAG: CoA-binding protein [Verrucomicrobia bacterium]|nr:CoA-binding protein [Verrucomicrobiota bacterium]
MAVIGASRNPEKVGYAFMHNLTRTGFEGTIVPINLEAPDILGVKCYKSLEEFGGKIDLSVIVVGGKYVKQSVQDSIRAGAKTIIVITAGFKEVGAKGAEAEQELVALCRAAGVRMMGPNCLGVLNTHHKMNATFAPSVPRPARSR